MAKFQNNNPHFIYVKDPEYTEHPDQLRGIGGGCVVEAEGDFADNLTNTDGVESYSGDADPGGREGADPGLPLGRTEDEAQKGEGEAPGLTGSVGPTGLTGTITTSDVPTQGEQPEDGEPDATPGAHEAAEELGVDLAEVEGSGAEGRITKADVEAHAEESE